MRAFLLLTTLWLLVPAPVPAQDPPVPGALRSRSPLASDLASQRFQADPGDLAPLRRAWVRSTAPLFAASALDVASSYGGRELNPLLAGRRGAFDARSAVLKLGLAGAVLGVQYLVLRKHPERARTFARLNWVVTGVTTGLAARNFAVR